MPSLDTHRVTTKFMSVCRVTREGVASGAAGLFSVSSLVSGTLDHQSHFVFTIITIVSIFMNRP